MRIVYMGTPDFAIPPLARLVDGKYEIASVYTQPDKPAGRGRSLVSPPLKRAALAMGLPVEQPVNLKSPEVVARLASLHPDVIVVAAFGQILPRSVLDVPEHGCINIHPSLLPKFRGASPVAAVILAGDGFTGVSIMLLDKGLDTGPILARAQISISPRDTTGSLTDKLSRIGAQLLLEVLPHWIAGELAPQPQNEAGATYSKPISREQAEIDWHLSAADIWRRLRAFNPWPGYYTRWQMKQLKIVEAVPLPEILSIDVGRVVALEGVDGSLGVAMGIGTGLGVLGVSMVQLEGKRVVTAAEFLRGQRQFIGALLPS